MIIVAGTVRIPAQKREALQAHAGAMLAATRKEPGCRLYSFAFDVEDAELMRIYEEWDSRADLEAHFKTPHMADWRKALGELGAHSRAVKAFKSDHGEEV